MGGGRALSRRRQAIAWTDSSLPYWATTVASCRFWREDVVVVFVALQYDVMPSSRFLLCVNAGGMKTWRPDMVCADMAWHMGLQKFEVAM